MCRRLLIFPGRFQPSIVSASELNCRVRDGNGCTLTAIGTDYKCMGKTAAIPAVFPIIIENGAPSGTRTRDTLIKSQVLYQLS